MLPSISVVVPVFNREQLIERCLDSILRQTLLPKEIIVVDNGSVDSTYHTVKEWMTKNSLSGVNMKLLSEESPGACAARRKGLENATGDYLIFFDSDDEMHSDLIEKAANVISSNPETDIVCWKVRIHQLDKSIKIPAFITKNIIESHLIHTLLRPQGYMVRKDFLVKAGGWQKSVDVWNDYELGLRLLIKKPILKAIDEILAEIYAQEISITGKNFSSKEGKWERTLEEMEEENKNSGIPEKDSIIKILNYRKAILAAHYQREGNKGGAKKLMKQTLKEISFKDKMHLIFSYHYTKLGLRGAWRIIRLTYL